MPLLDLPIRSLARGKLSVFLFHKVPQQRHPLVAHDPDLATFESVLDFVQSHFHILPLDEAVVRLSSGRLSSGAACITFDDGYPDWISGVVPALLKRNVPATFFITTGQFDGMPMWHERICHAVDKAPGEVLRLPTSFGIEALSMRDEMERRATVGRLEHFLKYQPLSRREALLAELEALAGVTPAAVPRMTVEQLKLLHSKGFAIGSHTVNHPILTLCSSNEARDEIGQAREILSGLIGGPVTSFAYPNGYPVTDFSAEHIRMVRQAGYKYAVTTDSGVATSATSLFQIPRFTPWGPTHLRHSLQIARNLRTRPMQLGEPTGETAPGEPSRILRAEGESLPPALMVAFHFPPQAGSSGILRTLNFVKNLPASGWKPIVLSAHPRAYEQRREDLMSDIPSDTEVIRAFALDSSRHLGIAGKYPQILALPDRWWTWWLGGVVEGMRAIERFRPKVLWSTAPIASAHMIAATLAKRSGLPWVADFRDPMVNADYPANPLQRRFTRYVEACVMQRSTCCVFTTERAADLYRRRYPHAAAKCHVIANGYDEQAFAQARPDRQGVAADKVFFLHSGIIYPRDRDPSAFFAAIRQLLHDGRLQRDKLCIRFRAPQHVDEVRQLAETHGLGDVVDIAPPIPYQAAIAEMLGADFLLVFQGAQFNAQIPAKIYEYLRAGRPLLALIDLGGDTAAQLRQFSAVSFADIADAAGIGRCVGQALSDVGRPEFQAMLACNVEAVRRFSRASQAESLARLFDAMAVGTPS